MLAKDPAGPRVGLSVASQEAVWPLKTGAEVLYLQAHGPDLALFVAIKVCAHGRRGVRKSEPLALVVSKVSGSDLHLKALV